MTALVRFAAALLAILPTACDGDGVGESSGMARAAPIQDAAILGGEGRGEGFFHQPRAVEVLANGTLFVIDRSGRVQRFSAAGAVDRSWLLPEWSRGQPIDLAATPWGTLLISDTHYARILETDLDGRELRRFGMEAGFELVRGIAVGAAETIYVADYGRRDRIHRFDRSGRHLGSFGSRGDGPADFLRPEGIAASSSGDVYVVDCGHHRVLRFDSAGEFISSFGGPGTEPGAFEFPFGIARGTGDTLYVVDFRGNRVQRFTADGRLLGAAGSAGRAPGTFAAPRGIAVLPAAGGDIVFVADTNNHRVQRFRWEHDF
ncbi:MAG: NHL repeat-containing protein [Planctomycetes bacterium]|nr:NHL repeat-containing protein [Planctomycetota bacterium]